MSRGDAVWTSSRVLPQREGLRWTDPWPVPAKHKQLGSLLNSSKQMLHYLEAVEDSLYLPFVGVYFLQAGNTTACPGSHYVARALWASVPTALLPTFLPPAGKTSWQKLRMRNISGLQQTRPGHRAIHYRTVFAPHLMHSFRGLFVLDAVSLKATPRPCLRRRFAEFFGVMVSPLPQVYSTGMALPKGRNSEEADFSCAVQQPSRRP